MMDLDIKNRRVDTAFIEQIIIERFEAGDYTIHASNIELRVTPLLGRDPLEVIWVSRDRLTKEQNQSVFKAYYGTYGRFQVFYMDLEEWWEKLEEYGLKDNDVEFYERQIRDYGINVAREYRGDKK